MEKNLSLFGKITEEKTEIVNLEKEKTLFITLDDERRDLKIEEIFDVSKYNKIKAVTYSVDESFINNYFSGFSEVELIIGIGLTISSFSFSKNSLVFLIPIFRARLFI